MNFEKCDRIMLSKSDYDKIITHLKNDISFSQVNFPIEEAVIELDFDISENRDSRITTEIHFVKHNGIIDADYYAVLNKNKRVRAFGFTHNTVSSQIRATYLDEEYNNVDPELIKVSIESISGSIARIMNFMNENINYKQCVSSGKSVVKCNNKNKKHTKKFSNVKPIIRTVYDLKYVDDICNVNGKQRNVHTESFPVRGHERKLKSGKVTWVKPYVKGDASKKQSKIYTME